MRFVRRRGSLQARLSEHEAAVLSALARDLITLVDAPAADAHADPLEAMVGLSGGPVERPRDPALARLLPDAYGEDDAAATEFRRYTEAELRSGKRAGAQVVLASLEDVGSRGALPLDRDQADAWLGTLNDLRLVLGTRLAVTENTELDLDDDDPSSQALHLYAWLGFLQESLLSALEPRHRG